MRENALSSIRLLPFVVDFAFPGGGRKRVQHPKNVQYFYEPNSDYRLDRETKHWKHVFPPFPVVVHRYNVIAVLFLIDRAARFGASCQELAHGCPPQITRYNCFGLHLPLSCRVRQFVDWFDLVGETYPICHSNFAREVYSTHSSLRT